MEEYKNYHSKDGAFKRYFSHRYIVKDILNALYFDGEQRIQEEDIEEKKIEHVSDQLKHAYRDLLFEVKFGEHEIFDVCLIGMEGQSSVDYAMSIRVLKYDAESLMKQVEECKSFTSKTKLIPPKTIVFNFSERMWNASRDVHGVLALKNEDDGIIQDAYEVIDIHDTKSMYVEHLQTELQSVLKFLQRQKDEEAISELLASDERYQRLSKDGAVFLFETAQIDYEINREEKVIDMCEAWKQRRERGIVEGRSEGYLNAKREDAILMLKDGLSAEKIASYTKQSVETIQQWAKELSKQS